MKRWIMMLPLLMLFAVPTLAGDGLYGFTGEIIKDPCILNNGWEAVMKEVAAEDRAIWKASPTASKEEKKAAYKRAQAATRKYYKAIDAQQAAYKKARAARDYPAAAKLALWRWVEAWQWNNDASDVCVAISDGASERNLVQNTEHFASDSSQGAAKLGMQSIANAKKALEEAALCATSSNTKEGIDTQVEACKANLKSNGDFLLRVLGDKKWPTPTWQD